MHLQHYHLIIICKLFHNNFKQLIIKIRFYRVCLCDVQYKVRYYIPCTTITSVR